MQLEALGLRVHFVDCWYYHIRLGEIHCGTNVLRAAPKTKVKWWEMKELAAVLGWRGGGAARNVEVWRNAQS